MRDGNTQPVIWCSDLVALELLYSCFGLKYFKKKVVYQCEMHICSAVIEQLFLQSAEENALIVHSANE